jgi:hypothetical protein
LLAVLVILPNLALPLAILTYELLPESLAVFAGFIVFFHGIFCHLVPGFIFGEPLYTVSVVLAPTGVMGWVISIAFYVVLSLLLAVLLKRKR